MHYATTISIGFNHWINYPKWYWKTESNLYFTRMWYFFNSRDTVGAKLSAKGVSFVHQVINSKQRTSNSIPSKPPKPILTSSATFYPFQTKTSSLQEDNPKSRERHQTSRRNQSRARTYKAEIPHLPQLVLPFSRFISIDLPSSAVKRSVSRLLHIIIIRVLVIDLYRL